MFNDYKQEVLPLANTEAGRFLLSKLGQKPEFPIVDIGKDYFIEDTGERTKNGKIKRATFYPRIPIKQLFIPILDKIHIANDYKRIDDKYLAFLHYSDLEKGKYPQIYLTETTFNPDANPETDTVDGRATDDSTGTFAQKRAAAGTGAEDSTTTCLIPSLDGATSPNYNYMARGIILFKTSAIPDKDVISSAILSLYADSKTDNHDLAVGITSSNPTSNTGLVAGDYALAKFGSTKFAPDIDLGSISTSAYNNWTFNAAGRNSVNKTGISKYGVRWDADIDNGTPTWHADASYITAQMAENTNKPKLVVTYAPPAGGNPMFFMGGGLTLG